MNANRIDVAAQTYQHDKADAMARRLHRTAMAGAAALVLTGGTLASGGVAAEVLSEMTVEEKKRPRFADIARRFVTPDFLESRRDRAHANRLLDEQVARVAQANRDVATVKMRSDAASKQLDKVREGLNVWERLVRSPQRLIDAENAKREAESALKSAQDNLAAEKAGKKERIEAVAKATLRTVAADAKREEMREFRAETIKALRDDASAQKETDVPKLDEQAESGIVDRNTSGKNEDSGEPEAPTPESGTVESDDLAADSLENPAEEDALGQPQVDPVAQAMASGVVLTQMANAAQQNADLFRRGMQDRLSGDDAFMQPTDIESTASGISTWAQAMGAQTTGRARGDIAGFSMRGAGIVTGVDVKKNNTRVGVAVGYGDATADARGENSQSASSKVSTYSVGLYGAHEVDGWFANGGVSYSAHSIKSQRAPKLDGEVYGLSGKTNATTVGGFAQFGKHIVTRAVNIDPSITLKVSNTSVKGFTENGDAGLKVDGSNFNSARVGIGARLWKAFGDESHSVTPSLRISYERELAHAAPSMDVALANAANAGKMTVTGNKLGRDIVSAETSVDVKLGKKLSLRGGVNGSVRQGQTQAGVAGSLKYVW
ncbi:MULTISPECIES: autotransporter outer membrane beta-barrel domain-containing protein [Pandoraea]|uniref:Outer membrane autotransporter barrel domain-containing protein n=1 Tax=Pandoraea communis TaxID=2508297 RepID=A0A5E4XCP2_9BURK|nr:MULTISPECIES: autotransporter outer membrane beta-barrel domain-containing protein [Pandoraea]EON13548.1 outer membrane autotransporter barrel domain-containing protein [Pandoraea sp. SD6-2]VVE33898.1 outer membrane autotransporter barrel domain-containing protein [Pandoraea communis]